MQLIFFKLDTSFNESYYSSNLLQFVIFFIICISQQNAFATLGLEGLSLVKWYPGPSFGTKNSQMRDIGLILMQCFEWCDPNH